MDATAGRRTRIPRACGAPAASGTVLSGIPRRVSRVSTNGSTSDPIDLARIERAAAHLQPYVRRTPTERSEPLGELTGRELVLKLENLQHTGAFKIRGALSRLLAMSPDDRRPGVITASAGNHGLGVALAARLLGISATVVVPTTVPLAKLTAIQRQGAEAVLEGPTYDDAHA